VGADWRHLAVESLHYACAAAMRPFVKLLSPLIRYWNKYCNTFWATVCKTVRPMLSVRCLSVLSETLVYCGQTVSWIKMKLRVQVGLGPVHIVLDVHPASPPQKGRSPISGLYLLWPNGWMDQDATCYGGRPRPRRLCVRWGHRSPLQKGGRALPKFRPMFIVATIDQDGT